MKNRLHFFLLALLIFNFSATEAQVKLSDDFTISTGKPYKVVDAKFKEYLGISATRALSVKSRGEEVIVQLFDVEKVTEISMKEYTDFPKYSKMIKLLKVGARVYYIFEAYNKKEKTFSVYSREVDVTNGTFNSAEKLFTTKMPAVNTKSVFTAGGFGFGGPSLYVPKKFEVFTSFDDSKVLIRYRNKPLSKKDAENYDRLGFYVFDSSMKKLWGTDVKMPYTEKEMNNLAYAVTKNGEACMLAYLIAQKKFELIKIGTDGKPVQLKLDINADLLFQEFYVNEDKDGNLNFAGYYANGMDYKFWSSSLSFNTNGIYQFTTDLNGKVLAANDYEFSKEFIDLYASERQKKKNAKREAGGKAGIPDVKLLNFTINSDGSSTFVGEQSWFAKEQYGMSQETVFHFAHAIVTRVAADGTLLWHAKIPKDQAGIRGKGGMSIKYMPSESSDYILFLDNNKNADIDFDTPPAKHKDGMGGILTAVKINNTSGKTERHTVLDPKNVRGVELFQFKPFRIFHVANNSFVLEAYLKGKHDGIIKLEIK